MSGVLTPELKITAQIMGSGPRGEKGEQGSQGPIGITGEQGTQGLKGDVGDIGPKGDMGAQGPQGIQGIKGDQGDTGPQGQQGEIGPQGLQGIQGIQGDVGPQGIQGVKGEKGDPLAVTQTPLTLPTSGWAGTTPPYTQSVTVTGITNAKTMNFFPVYSATLATAISQQDAYNEISDIAVTDNTVTFKCFYSKPLVDLPILIKWV